MHTGSATGAQAGVFASRATYRNFLGPASKISVCLPTGRSYRV